MNQNQKRKHQKKSHHKKRKHSSSRSSSSSSASSRRSFQPKAAPKIEEPKPIEKELPCFEPSGILLRFAANAITADKVLKFTQPLDAKIPTKIWKLYPFKGEISYDSIPLQGKSAFLIGKDEEIADIPLRNPSISSQHAVIQFREVRRANNKGEVLVYIKPYLLDLESTNGTTLNGQKIEPARYYELLDEDLIKFGYSEREFILVSQ